MSKLLAFADVHLVLQQDMPGSGCTIRLGRMSLMQRQASDWIETANGDADAAVANCTPVDTSQCVQMGLLSTTCMHADMDTTVMREMISNRD